jgi:hypothetical protein
MHLLIICVSDPAKPAKILPTVEHGASARLSSGKIHQMKGRDGIITFFVLVCWLFFGSFLFFFSFDFVVIQSPDFI